MNLARLIPRDPAGRVRLAVVAVLFAIALLIPPLGGFLSDALPDLFDTRFINFLGTAALVLALWSVSYNLMLGYTGMVSFAHAAYYGIGSYTVGLLFAKLHWSVLVGLLLAPFTTAVLGLLTGLIALRAVRLYFSLLTLALSQFFFVIAFEWYSFTGGDNGIHGIVVPDAVSDPTILYYLVAAIVGLCLLLMFLVVRSPFGASLAAIRENRLRAASIGINVKAHELAVFTIAAAFAGVAGALYSIYDLQAYPQLMYWTRSADPVVVTLLGGTGSFLGPAIGAFVYTGLSNTIGKNFPQYFDVVLGAVVLGVVLAFPGGFASLPELLNRGLGAVRGRGRRSEETTGEALLSMDVARAIEAKGIHAEKPVSGQALLAVENVSRAFGGLRAVDGVSLTVLAGDRHAVIGPNGAGKSTLFNLITGRMKPTAGRILLEGRDITGRSPHRIARAGIGRAFQITSIFPQLSVRHNLQYSMMASRGVTSRPFGWADRIFRDEAMELLESVGLARFAELPAGQLSHGDQRALELAISMALGSRLLLLDEPTAGMSPYETEKAMELVRQVVAERGLTLLFCEHDMSVVFGTARTVTVMHQGRVLTEGTPEEVRSNPDVQKVYLGELEIDEAQQQPASA